MNQGIQFSYGFCPHIHTKDTTKHGFSDHKDGDVDTVGKAEGKGKWSRARARARLGGRDHLGYRAGRSRAESISNMTSPLTARSATSSGDQATKAHEQLSLTGILTMGMLSNYLCLDGWFQCILGNGIFDPCMSQGS